MPVGDGCFVEGGGGAGDRFYGWGGADQGFGRLCSGP